MTTPPELPDPPEHLWARMEGDRVRVGVTDYAHDQLGPVVYVDLPTVGTTVTAGAPFGEVEYISTAWAACSLPSSSLRLCW